MLTEPFVALLLAAVAVNAILLTAVVAEHRGRAADGGFGSPPNIRPTEWSAVMQDRAGLDFGPGAVPVAYDRVVRVASWAFILATTTLVAVSGMWAATQTAIFVLLALAGLFLLTVHDLLPSTVLGDARYILEGSLAITFVTILLVLTGGPSSPFFFADALIVAGAALVLSPPITLLVAGLAVGGYLLGVLANPAFLPLTTPQLVAVAVNVATLLLLTYIGTVIARDQRRRRDAAIELSTIDSLTRLYNRAYLFAAVEREIQRSTRSRRGFCLLMMDVDDLKLINDRFGHFHGDRVLRGVSEIIRKRVRRIDTAARYGGDEFVILLPETDPTGAFVLAEMVRQGVDELAIQTPAERIRTTVSIGAVAFPEDGRTTDELMISADQAMYSSKRQGKNRTAGGQLAPSSVGDQSNNGTGRSDAGVEAARDVSGSPAGSV